MFSRIRSFIIIAAISFAGVYFKPASAEAEQVTPSDRVVTQLRVRAEPNTTSAIIARIKPEESVERSGGVSGWWEVRLSDGQTGFVSKAWSRVIDDAINDVLRLGAWNIKKLGHGSDKDYPLVARIIDDHMDIVAVVEVMQKGGGHPGYDDLLVALGADWIGFVTTDPRPNTGQGSAEFYAVLFKTKRVALCEGWTGLVFHIDNDGGPDGNGENRFSREPAYTCLSARNASGEIGFDFLLAPYHAVFAGGNVTTISAEAGHLESVFVAMANARQGENDLIIAGDFNLMPAILEGVVGRPVTTIGSGSTLNSSGELTQHLYDHFLIADSSATVEISAPARVLDVRSSASSRPTFFSSASDHLPIVVNLDVSGPDDD